MKAAGKLLLTVAENMRRAHLPRVLDDLAAGRAVAINTNTITLPLRRQAGLPSIHRPFATRNSSNSPRDYCSS